MIGTIWARWHDGTMPGRGVGWLLWQVVAERGPYLDVRPLWSDDTEAIHRHCLTGELTWSLPKSAPCPPWTILRECAKWSQ